MLEHVDAAATTAPSPANSAAGVLIVRLRECASLGAACVGTKASNLGNLLSLGFPVPDGFVVTAAAFGEFLTSNALDTQGPQESVSGAPLPQEVERAVRAALGAFGDASLAVRSSGAAEDLPDASFAGQYETVLDVRGADAVLAAIRRCWGFAFAPRVASYRIAHALPGAAPMAVLIQRLVPADAAGVAFSANPVTGNRDEIVVNAVRGLGERLVSGHAIGDEWVVHNGQATCQRAPEGAIDAAQALAVSDLARRVEQHFGTPQDIEWAVDGESLFLLQARPITALPELVDWTPPAPGGWLRDFRLGEWLGDPVTPLSATWLLPALDERYYANVRRIIGVRAPRPLQVFVNGWYFASGNVMPRSPGKVAALMLGHFLPRLIVRPRRASVAMPGIAHWGVRLYERDMAEKFAPEYRKVVGDAVSRVESATPEELVRLVDQAVEAAGDFFFIATVVGGYAWKSEVPLAEFYREHLEPRIGGTHQRLVQGLGSTAPQHKPHAVLGLDWFHPTLGERGPVAQGERAGARLGKARADREAAETEARATLAATPKLLAKFERLLAVAQRYAVTREQQYTDFTLGWPVMRRALLRLGSILQERGAIAAGEDVFFLTREEVDAAIGGNEPAHDLTSTVEERRKTWQRQRRLVPPTVLGELPPILGRIIAKAKDALGARSDAADAVVVGIPASPGRSEGIVRVIRGAEEFDRLQPGEVLVAPATTPAWTPLFERAAAVVTDGGSLVAHASLVAREYGIPSVVAAEGATTKLRDGQRVLVDGTNGFVRLLT